VLSEGASIVTERQQVYKLVLGFFEGDEKKARLWMRTANPLTGHLAPKDLIALRPGKTLKAVKQALAENER
jgi:hypothetical protein